MKRKFSMLLLAVFVCCLSMFVGAVPVMAEDVPENDMVAEQPENDMVAEQPTQDEIARDTVEADNTLARIEGVRCVDGVRKGTESDDTVLKRLYNTNGIIFSDDTFEYNIDSNYLFLKEYIDMTYDRGYADYTYLIDENNQGGTYVTVSAREKAEVSWLKKNGRKFQEINAVPDIYAGTTIDGVTYARDIYYFFIPYKDIISKKGAELIVKVKDGEDEKELKVTFTKPTNKKVRWKGKIKAKLTYPSDSDLGRIELTLNGSKARFATGEVFKRFDSFETVEVENKHVRTGMTMKFSTKDIEIGKGTATRKYKEVSVDDNTKNVNHTTRHTKVDEDARFRLGDYTSPTGKSRWKEHFVSVASYSDTEWVINSTIWDMNLAMKTVRVRIPAQRKAPNTRVNAQRGKINITDNHEYKIKFNYGEGEQQPDADTLDRDGFPKEWTTGKKGMTLNDFGEKIASGAVIKVRAKGTNKKVPSAIVTITVPARQPINLAPITVSGPVSKCAIKISDLHSSKNPYEYTLEKPTANTKWKKISTATKKLGAKAINAAEPVIYIRKKATNENVNQKIELRVASEIAKFTYNAETGTWTGVAWYME